MKKFSLLIAHYNNFDYFLDCYKSIVNQTFEDFEVIIVDDCSTEDSFAQLQELIQKDERFKVFRNPENKGVGYTKRRCVELATGEICGFVDPDDALANDALEISLNQYANPEVAGTHSELFLCDNQLNVLRKFPNTKNVKAGDRKFFNINFEINHFFTFRKSVYQKTSGINPELTSAVDQDLYLKMYDSGNLIYIEKPLYFYRLHEKGVSQEKNKKPKLNQNWHKVLKDTVSRREINQLYGKKVTETDDLPKFIFNKQNTLIAKILKKIS